MVREFGPDALGGEFYRLAGWFFASGQVRAALGTAMTVTEGDWWLVLCDGETSIGLCGCSVNKGATAATLKYIYVSAEHRSALYGPFLSRSLQFLGGKFPGASLQTTCHESAVLLYLKEGFKEQSRRGQYAKLARPGGDVS